MDDNLNLDLSLLEMEDLGPFIKDRHKRVAHDLPLINLLLGHWCLLIQIIYATKKGGEQIAETAEETIHAVNLLLELMQEKAETEHPGADFLKGYSLSLDTYPDSKEYPPSIELKDKSSIVKSEV